MQETVNEQIAFFSTLEYDLLHTDFTNSFTQLESVLSGDLFEISPFGDYTSRQEIIDWLINKSPNQSWSLSNFRVMSLTDRLFLVCYQANSIQNGLVKETGTLRSSIWRNEQKNDTTFDKKNWKLTFHQATPN